MNIDWPNALVGALVGWILGFAFDRFILWSRRVKVQFLGFESVQTNFGVLHKIRFRLKGHEDPGEANCEIGAHGHVTLAKWDETPNPLRNDRLDAFAPEMVPMTFFHRLHVGKEYRIPLAISVDEGVFVFDGWWFGRGTGYYKQSPLKPEDTITVSLRGNGFTWSRRFNRQEVEGVPKTGI